ncbi:GAF domain-containing protein [Adhaeribacter radiodurans]|uniref:GAF domain-containing protein n=1 Tax=Adhaeribacter radiodurans TaxID=2745197 RepID=A0A7L7L119_9BACT|nr:GAF domain-containing protein [Adhaeribacter radiodurans]QMU26496.1 GAF domain-containing protein [Adhaeribacter radiodurans]
MENTFGLPLIPENESERLAALRRLNLPKTYVEDGTFKHITAMAARMFQVPIAIVNVVEEYGVITLAGTGMEAGTVIPRGISLCSLSILDDNVTVFQQAKDEPCLLANPLVHGEFGLEFYAAAPLKTAHGQKIGALCLVDKKPRAFSALDQRILENLASIVMDEIMKKSQETDT